MPFEVEIKYRVGDLSDLRRECESLAGPTTETRSEVDTYLKHPGRSFAQTDEALRIRQVESHIVITYKGPKIDATTKTRTEIELELIPGPHTFAEVLEFWRLLGFTPAGEVRKRREIFRIPWAGRDVHVSLDQVQGLGEFVELELSAESAQLEESRQILKSLASKLGLHNSERKSYLELLLEKEGTSADRAKNTEDWTE